MGAQHSQRFTASDFRRIAKRNPQEAEQYLRDIVPDISGEVEQRRAVMGGLVHISGELPYAVKPFVGQLVSRVDDVDPEVRTNALLTISHCVQYYPHEFSNISGVLYHSLLDGVDFERAAALAAVVELSRHRPDMVDPRYHIKQELEAALQQTKYQDLPDEAPYPEDEELTEAITALSGGGLSSRPVEDDLSPVGRETQLSAPARLAFVSALTAPLALINIAILAVSVASKTQEQSPTPSIFLKNPAVYKSRHRLRLALRQSSFILPSQVLGFLPGEAPVPPERGPPADPPDNWHQMTSDIWKRDEKTCRNCGADLSNSSSANPFVDLKVPAENGGEFHPANARTLCKECVQARHGEQFAEGAQ
jgi:hypothetical protein